MSSPESSAAQRAVDVLPSHVGHRVTRRDGLLPLVLALELAAGVVFGIAAQSGHSSVTGVPAKLTLAPVSVETVLTSSRPAVGPAIGPLRPGTVRGVLPAATAPVASAPTFQRHAARNPFAALVTVQAP